MVPWLLKTQDGERQTDRETKTERDCRVGEKNKNEVTKYMNLTFRKEVTEVKGWMIFIKREDKYLITDCYTVSFT